MSRNTGRGPRRAIQRLIQDPLALQILNGDFVEGDTIVVDVDSEHALRFSKQVPLAA